MLFLYASGGARAAIVGREPKFINGLVLCCEALAYVSATCYFVLGFSLFGNPNALGAIIGVVAFPVLLWAGLVADTRGLRQRRLFALVLCGALLYRSNSRASILGAATVVLLFTIALRYKRLMLQFAFVTVFFVTLMAVINPSRIDELASSFFGRVIYKEQTGAHAAGVFGSRLSPWSETILVIRRRPWFGSGFGTSDLGESRRDANVSSVYTTQGTNREHGNSYLALAEYLGLLCLVPFLLLLVMVLRSLIRILYWMRKTGNAYHYCIPFALVVIAGLVHACFEDWLFAVGSYLCVFFWISAFVLLDLMPAAAPFRSSVAYQPRPDPLATSASAAIAHSLH
jgi:O-antigen ligase